MTVSDTRRIQDVNDTLRIFMAELDNRALSDYLFMQEDSTFAGVLPTTWDELKRRGWIRKSGDMHYTLAGPGWKAGLDLMGRLDADFRTMAFKLVAALKDKISGRREDATALTLDFEAQGMTGGFVFNVVESSVLEDLDLAKDYGLRWSGDPWDSPAPLFIIPRTFGQRRLAQ